MYSLNESAGRVLRKAFDECTFPARRSMNVYQENFIFRILLKPSMKRHHQKTFIDTGKIRKPIISNVNCATTFIPGDLVFGVRHSWPP